MMKPFLNGNDTLWRARVESGLFPVILLLCAALSLNFQVAEALDAGDRPNFVIFFLDDS